MTKQDQRKGEQFSCKLLSRCIGFPKPVNSHVRENSLWNSWLYIGQRNNIATAENKTSLRRGVSSDASHNMRSSQSGYYATNYTRPIPFRQVSLLWNGFSNVDFSVLTKNKIFLRHFDQNCTKMSKQRKFIGRHDKFRNIQYLLIAWWKSYLHVTNTLTKNYMETALAEFLYWNESRWTRTFSFLQGWSVE